jgi:hypothetical protein
MDLTPPTRRSWQHLVGPVPHAEYNKDGSELWVTNRYDDTVWYRSRPRPHICDRNWGGGFANPSGAGTASASERSPPAVLNDSGLCFYAAATISSRRTTVSTQMHSEDSTIEGQTE